MLVYMNKGDAMNTHHLEMTYKGNGIHETITIHGSDKPDLITKGKAHLRDIGLDWTAITKVAIRFDRPNVSFLSMIAPARQADGSYRV